MVIKTIGSGNRVVVLVVGSVSVDVFFFWDFVVVFAFGKGGV